MSIPHKSRYNDSIENYLGIRQRKKNLNTTIRWFFKVISLKIQKKKALPLLFFCRFVGVDPALNSVDVVIGAWVQFFRTKAVYYSGERLHTAVHRSRRRQ